VLNNDPTQATNSAMHPPQQTMQPSTKKLIVVQKMLSGTKLLLPAVMVAAWIAAASLMTPARIPPTAIAIDPQIHHLAMMIFAIVLTSFLVFSRTGT
jgi:hypothetical protein